MSDKIYKYKGQIILKNYLGYRIAHLFCPPVFKTLKEAKKYVSGMVAK